MPVGPNPLLANSPQALTNGYGKAPAQRPYCGRFSVPGAAPPSTIEETDHAEELNGYGAAYNNADLRRHSVTIPSSLASAVTSKDQFVPIAAQDIDQQIADESGLIDLPNGVMPNGSRQQSVVPTDPGDEDGEETPLPELELLYQDSNFKDTALTRLNTMRKNRELCDVVFYINQRELYAHKAVLSVASTYLYELFVNSNDPNSVSGSIQSNAAPFRSSSTSPSPVSTPNRGVPGSTFATLTEHDGTLVLNGKPISAGAQASGVGLGKSKMPTANRAYFEFNDVDPDCFEALINFAYTATLRAKPEKVKMLYKLAFLLKMQSCTKACAKYLVETLSSLNCIGVRKCANRTNDSLLASKVDAYIQQSFAEITDRSKEFTSLPCVQIEVVLSGDQMIDLESRFRDEYYIGDKVVSWMQTEVLDLPEHVEFRMDLLTEKVHVLFLDAESVLRDCFDADDSSAVGSTEYIQDYKRSARKGISGCQVLHPVNAAGGKPKPLKSQPSYFNSNKSSRYASNDSLASFTSEADEVEWKLIAVSKTSEKCLIGLAVLQRQLAAVSIHICEALPSVAVLGGVTRFGVTDDRHSASRHSSGSSSSGGGGAANGSNSEDESVMLAHMVQPRCSCGAVNLEGKIVVCGGYDRGECLKTVETYDLDTNTWSNLLPMLKERGRFDVTLCNGKIYAIGGSDGQKDLVCAEVYDPDSKKWKNIAGLQLARSNNGCASAGGKIYSVGGWTGQAALRNCDFYDPETDKWTAAAPLNHARYQASCDSWNGKLLAVGGCDHWNCLNTVELYDPTSNSWTVLPRMSSSRRGCGVSVLNNKLYVIGGSDGTQSLKSVEIFDLEKFCWLPTGPCLNVPRANVRAVTIGNRIYAVGGFTGKVFLNSIEYLEEGSGEWRVYHSIHLSSKQISPHQHSVDRAASETTVDDITVTTGNDSDISPVASHFDQSTVSS